MDRLTNRITKYISILLLVLITGCRPLTRDKMTESAIPLSRVAPSETIELKPTATFIHTETPEIEIQPIPTTQTPGIDLTEAALVKPLAPSEVIVEKTDNGVLVKWHITGEDVKYFQVYRKDSTDSDWLGIAQVEPAANDQGWLEYLDSQQAQGVTYYYGITAVNLFGDESPMTESAAITP